MTRARPGARPPVQPLIGPPQARARWVRVNQNPRCKHRGRFKGTGAQCVALTSEEPDPFAFPSSHFRRRQRGRPFLHWADLGSAPFAPVRMGRAWNPWRGRGGGWGGIGWIYLWFFGAQEGGVRARLPPWGMRRRVLRDGGSG